MNWTYARVRELEMELSEFEAFIEAEEMNDRRLVKYYQEKGEDYDHVQKRVDQYMIQRGQIQEVIDIIDGLKVKV